jgi:hypothetical protein
LIARYFVRANLLVRRIIMFAIIDDNPADSPEITIKGSPGGSPSQIVLFQYIYVAVL